MDFLATFAAHAAHIKPAACLYIPFGLAMLRLAALDWRMGDRDRAREHFAHGTVYTSLGFL